MGFWNKVMGALALVGIALAFVFKLLLGRETARANREEKRADTAEAVNVQREQVDEKAAAIDAAQGERREAERKDRAAGRRRGLDNQWSWLLVLLFMAGCTNQVVVPPLPGCPPRPVLPAVTEDELQCISEATYDTLEERDRLRREYAEDLEAFCQRKE